MLAVQDYQSAATIRKLYARSLFSNRETVVERVMGLKVQISISEGSLSVHQGLDQSIRLARYKHIQEGETTSLLYLTGEPNTLLNAI